VEPKDISDHYKYRKENGSKPGGLLLIRNKLCEIDSRLAEDMEEEYVFLYPHVVERLRIVGIKPRVAYEPGRVPKELV